MLAACIGDAMGLIWSACISSQTMAWGIVLVKKRMHNKLESELLLRLSMEEHSEYAPRSRCCVCTLSDAVSARKGRGQALARTVCDARDLAVSVRMAQPNDGSL